ncbi:MAG TPA: hypothetical protein VKE29_06485 [Candidatus Udaeobacter sp.]|nr:hypothetical protein [Candidatus Udaeobacter sp.]HMF46304.1 hypothetical protein [Candidatus Udaeobacter sp.]
MFSNRTRTFSVAVVPFALWRAKEVEMPCAIAMPPQEPTKDTASSVHHDGGEKGSVPSLTAPQEQEVAPPTLFKRVLHLTPTVIAAGLLIACFLLLHKMLPAKKFERIMQIEKKVAKIISELLE